MAENFEITDEMRAAVGVASEPWTHEITTTSVRSFARGVGYEDPVYYDIEAARAAGYESLPAPPTYLGTPIYIPARSDSTFSGPRASRQGVNHGLKNVLDGGTETVYERTLVAGDVLSVTSLVANLEKKQSRALGDMLIVTSETTGRDQSGEVVVRQRSQGIFY